MSTEKELQGVSILPIILKSDNTFVAYPAGTQIEGDLVNKEGAADDEMYINDLISVVQDIKAGKEETLIQFFGAETPDTKETGQQVQVLMTLNEEGTFNWEYNRNEENISWMDAATSLMRVASDMMALHYQEQFEKENL
ncbi:MAG: hypothetical protein AAF599_09665 [Bacteroidota bacterium]